jgi:cell wall-associated NlpC family hydrolase
VAADDSDPVVVPSARRLVPRRLAIAAAVAAACALAAFVLLSALGGGERPAGASAASAPAAKPLPPEPAASPPAKPLRSHPKVVVAVPPGEAPPADAATTTPPSGGRVARPPTDAEVRNELADFRQHLTGFGVARGPIPEVRSDGTAVAPLEAPDVVATVIAAGNEIATKPYKWGGGHGAWRDSGYDCSGSISFALAGAGLLETPLDSTRFMHWGAKGRGRWITIYANAGHAFMVVAGIRFDTSGAQGGGTRWQPAAARSYNGFTARHPPGL